MPNHVENVEQILEYIAEELSEQTSVDIMAQYQPYHKAKTEDFYEEISRPITGDEYEEVVSHVRREKSLPLTGLGLYESHSMEPNS